MVENTERRLKHINPQSEDLRLIEMAHQTCLRIEEELRLHYGLAAPSLGRVRRRLSLWVGEIRESNQQASTVETKKVPAPHEFTLEISPPKQEQSKPEELQHSPNNPKKYLVAASFAMVIAITLFFFYPHYQKKQLIAQVNQASIPELASIVDELNSQNNRDTLSDLRQPTITRLDQLMDGWTLDPVRVNNLDKLEHLTNQLLLLYPDSNYASKLQQDFQLKKASFDKEFEMIYQRFSIARTAIANATLHQTDKKSVQAYKYSNSLFPLLGRIEYSEKHKQQKDVERSLQLLNTYLYKINQLKTESNNVQ
ncbi:type VI secretion protein [Vibrio intestinalis]|uniref:type VI secretion protein n=1 Tax=Vibrio intestinalis TaxID=2933291 RepID=UPI0021A5F543|nr:type VI secretion protein [Vibrio intestinalis]